MKTKFLVIAFFSFCYSANAQFDVPQLTTPAPPSPNAASLGKYGEIPVSLSTGVPNIDIPLYEIKTGNISLPITINYHAGGVKVEERASWIGLGWSLNAGGVITRMCRGKADEDSGGFKSMGYKVLQYPDSMTGAQQRSYVTAVDGGAVDGEPDIFYYNFGVYSGKFFFTNSGEIVTMPRNNLKIRYIDDPHGWEIVTPDGNKYLFNEVEVTTSTPYFSNGGSQEDGTPVTMETSWYLKKITDVYANTVQFEYDDEDYFFDTHKQFTQRVLKDPINAEEGCSNASGYSFSTVEIQGKRIANLTYTNGELDFVASATSRSDLGTKSLSKIQIKNSSEVLKEWRFATSYFNNTTPSTSRLKLDTVKEVGGIVEGAKYAFDYDSSVSGGLPLVTSFDEDYWGYNNGASNTVFVKYNLSNGTPAGANKEVNSFYTQAGILKKITYPTGGTTEFQYENNQAKKLVAAHYEDAGLYASLFGNNYDSTESILNFQQTFTITSTELSPVDSLAHMLVYIGETVGPNPTGLEHIVSCIISDQYNTTVFGGTSINTNGLPLNLTAGTYTIKAHLESEYPGDPEVAFGVSLNLQTYVPQGLVSKISGGLRIKQITTKAFDTGVSEIKVFKYNLFGDTLSSGTSADLPIYKYESYTLIDLISSCGWDSYTSSPQYPISTTSGSAVIYGNVTTISGTDTAMGKTESTFSSYDDVGDNQYNTFPFPSPTTREYQRGSLLKETKYKKVGNAFTKVSEEENIYQASGYTNIKESEGIKFGRYISGYTYLDSVNFYNGLSEARTLTLSEIYNLQAKKIRTYSSSNPNDSLEMVTYYYYSDTHYQPTKITTTNSKGEQINVFFKYPHEMQSISSPNVYNEMVARHIWSPVIEKSQFRDSTKFIQSIKTNYNYWYSSSWGTNNPNCLLVPQTIETTILDHSADVRIRYHSYDSSGNVTSVSKENDVKHSYLWGYNKTYPVAEVIGADYATVSALVDQQILDAPSSDAALRTELNNLRTGLATTQALIQTYTYKLLVGISSQTDTNGQTIYYEYDSLNQLKIIKDQDGNIVKKTEYKYRAIP